MSKSSLNVLQIPHVTTCWQTFLGLADGEFLARVPGIFHCLIPGACEEDEAVWLPALSFRFSWQSRSFSLILLYIYLRRTLNTPFNNVNYRVDSARFFKLISLLWPLHLLQIRWMMTLTQQMPSYLPKKKCFGERNNLDIQILLYKVAFEPRCQHCLVRFVGNFNTTEIKFVWIESA